MLSLLPVITGLGFIAIPIHYLIASFKTPLPWSECQVNNLTEKTCVTNNDSATYPTSFVIQHPLSSSSEYYYKYTVKKESDNVSSVGMSLPDAELVGCLLLGWLVISLAYVKGVRSFGKMNLAMTILSVSILLILFIRSILLPGAKDGIRYYFSQDYFRFPYGLSSLLSITLFSIGDGSLITLASYNRFSHNIYRDTFIVPVVEIVLSLLASLFAFSILGHLAITIPIDEIRTRGFIYELYPDFITLTYGAPNFFAVIFYLLVTTASLHKMMTWTI